ncbi:hypothetical protein [Synoicihabitans lomoniglobus]|uniref:Uncharacterized protein n=1 Tax=Synoicihabitans lomoniglobus TaxID=2909285 RepID=A0AAF0I543_9BACT|nr:hypothetical protein [Opitutaceae bacterium LMO-M01]WED66840.1 hypothetical protein PXH66_08255 [Opitutaceae bacterium LMO-M01]
MGKAKDAETLGVHTRKEIVAEIIRRGDALGQKKGTYAAAIFEWWWEQGCPPVTKPDELMEASKPPKKNGPVKKIAAI